MLIKNRVKKHGEFQEIIEKGKLERSNSLNMYYVSNTLGYTRIGISVPKKSGSAVTRNKIKRQLRAIFSKTIDFKKSFDLVFIIRKAFNTSDFKQTETEVLNLINRIG